MADISPILSLPYLAPAQAQKHVTHNAALQRLDILVQLVVQDFDATEPPAVPAEGAVYATGTDAADAWAGQDNRIAAFTDGAWLFVDPQDGWVAIHAATGAQRVWQSDAWGTVPLDLDNLDGVGIGATADATNRLSVSAPATLLSHAGAGHQLKLNKAGTGDTASLLYQSNWSGRAEMGLAGEDAFSVKVSADGAAWTTALSASAANGVSMPTNPAFAARGTGGWTDITTQHTDLTSFDTAIFNRGGFFNTANGQFATPEAGIYAFNINGFLGSTTDSRVTFGRNGVSLTSEMQVLVGAVPLSMTVILDLDAGDTITVRTGNAGTNSLLRYYTGHTTFSGWRVA